MLKSKYTYLFLITLFFNIVFSQNEELNGWKINPKITTTIQNKALTIVNGIFVNDEILRAIDPKNIEKLNILKYKQAIEKYGEKGKNGAIEVTTKNISNKELKKLYLLYAETYLLNKGKIKIISGKITDCEDEFIQNTSILNLNSKVLTTTDSLGNYTIEARKNDVLQISKMGFEGKKVLITNEKKLDFSLKVVPVPEGIIYRKPVIYLYPIQKTEVTITLDVKGKLLTTFPKYDKNWKVIAEPSGQLFDIKTKRNYSSLFWDADVQLPEEHYQYKDGFVISKENLTAFFIEKLEHIGLNNQETNEFIQFWLPILEQNEYNFIHFRVNEECDVIAKLNVNPKPETSIRVYMEYYGIDELNTIKEQVLTKIERKGFTLVEWGGAEIKQ